MVVTPHDFIRKPQRRHASAKKPLDAWLKTVTSATWSDFPSVQKTLKTADQIKLKSGRTVVVFNIKGSDYRLITSIDYEQQRIRCWYFLTHSEYMKNDQAWKNSL